jgi:hypothetical protein
VANISGLTLPFDKKVLMVKEIEAEQHYGVADSLLQI